MKVLQNTIVSIDTMVSQSESSWDTARISVCSYAYRKFVTPLFVKFVLVLITFIFSVPTQLYSNSISIEDAKDMAISILNDNNVSLAKLTSTYYIFVSNNNSSYVIVANNNITNPILGYSLSGGWVEEKMPPILLKWLNSLNVDSIELTKCPPKRTSRSDITDAKESVPILLTSRWHQDSPYNDLCPVITDGNIKTAAGCVAIASAQVVYYWRKDNPLTTSEDTPIYPYGKAPVTYSIPAGTEFKWDLMKDYYSLYESDEEKEAVARLTYIIGTSTYLQYGTSTGGQINDIINPYSKQFNLNAKFASKKDHSQEEWEQLIYINLKKKQPVVYAGSTGNDAHAVVVDGYNAETNLFHFNFGWGGNGDGYYTIDDVTGMNGYMLGQECVYDIYPRQRNLEISLSVIDDLYTNTLGTIDLSVRNGSTFNIDGLYLFISRNFVYPTNKDDAIWYHDAIVKNDDSDQLFSVKFTPTFSSSRCYLILTDGDLNVLAQKRVAIQESNGIYNVINCDESVERYYSINGKLLHQKPSKGIYIRKKKDGISKVLVEY